MAPRKGKPGNGKPKKECEPKAKDSDSEELDYSQEARDARRREREARSARSEREERERQSARRAESPVRLHVHHMSGDDAIRMRFISEFCELSEEHLRIMIEALAKYRPYLVLKAANDLVKREGKGLEHNLNSLFGGEGSDCIRLKGCERTEEHAPKDEPPPSYAEAAAQTDGAAGGKAPEFEIVHGGESLTEAEKAQMLEALRNVVMRAMSENRQEDSSDEEQQDSSKDS